MVAFFSLGVTSGASFCLCLKSILLEGREPLLEVPGRSPLTHLQNLKLAVMSTPSEYYGLIESRAGFPIRAFCNCWSQRGGDRFQLSGDLQPFLGAVSRSDHRVF